MVGVQRVREPPDLRLTGRTLEEVRSGYAVVLQFSDGYEVTVESTVRLDGAGGGVEVEPDELPSPALDRLVGDTVRAAGVRDTGELTIAFGSGRELVVSVDADYESWNVTGPDGLLVVCLPGGGLAVWGVAGTAGGDRPAAT